MKFTTTILQPEGRSVTGIEVPADVVAALGAGKRPPIVITVNGYSYRSTVAVMGGKFMVGLPAEHRTAAGVNGGDTADIDIVLDTASRAVEPPQDLATALDAAGLRTAYEKLAPSHQKEHVRSVNEAKTAETRARRIAKIIEKLTP